MAAWFKEGKAAKTHQNLLCISPSPCAFFLLNAISDVPFVWKQWNHTTGTGQILANLQLVTQEGSCDLFGLSSLTLAHNFSDLVLLRSFSARWRRGWEVQCASVISAFLGVLPASLCLWSVSGFSCTAWALDHAGEAAEGGEVWRWIFVTLADANLH